MDKSSQTTSWTLHDVQLPQSWNAVKPFFWLKFHADKEDVAYYAWPNSDNAWHFNLMSGVDYRRASEHFEQKDGWLRCETFNEVPPYPTCGACDGVKNRDDDYLCRNCRAL